MFGPGSNNGSGEGGGNYNNDMKKAKSQVSLIRFLFYYTFYCLFHFITLFIIGSLFFIFDFSHFYLSLFWLHYYFTLSHLFFYFLYLYTVLISTLFRSLLSVSVSSLFITFCNDQAPTAGGFDIGLPTLRKLMDLLRLDAVGIVSKVRER